MIRVAPRSMRIPRRRWPTGRTGRRCASPPTASTSSRARSSRWSRPRAVSGVYVEPNVWLMPAGGLGGEREQPRSPSSTRTRPSARSTPQPRVDGIERPRSLGDEPEQRSAPLRKGPSKRPCFRCGSYRRRPQDGQRSASGQLPHRGTRARRPWRRGRRAPAARPDRTSARPLLDPGDVRVDRQHRLAERLIPNRGRRVGPDPRQFGQVGGPAVRGHAHAARWRFKARRL